MARRRAPPRPPAPCTRAADPARTRAACRLARSLDPRAPRHTPPAVCGRVHSPEPSPPLPSPRHDSTARSRFHPARSGSPAPSLGCPLVLRSPASHPPDTSPGLPSDTVSSPRPQRTHWARTAPRSFPLGPDSRGPSPRLLYRAHLRPRLPALAPTRPARTPACSPPGGLSSLSRAAPCVCTSSRSLLPRDRTGHTLAGYSPGYRAHPLTLISTARLPGSPRSQSLGSRDAPAMPDLPRARCSTESLALYPASSPTPTRSAPRCRHHRCSRVGTSRRWTGRNT